MGKFNIYKRLRERWRRKKVVKERLHYLDNLKPIQPNKYILDECTVGKEM